MKKKISEFVSKEIRIFGVGIPLMAVLLLSALAAVTVVTAIEQAAKGAELVYLEKKADRFIEENKELSSKLIMDSSLSKVSDVASREGMVKPEKIVYLAGEAQPVAELR